MLNQEVLVRPTELKEQAILVQAALALAAEGFDQVSAGELEARTKELGSHVPDWRIGQLGPTLGMVKGHTKAGNRLTLSVSSLQLAKRELEEETAAIQPRIDDAVAFLQPLIGEIENLEKRVLLHKSLRSRLQAAEDYLSAHDTSQKGLWMEFGPPHGVKETEAAVRELQANKRKMAQLEKALEERPAVMAQLEQLEADNETTLAALRENDTTIESQRQEIAVQRQEADRKDSQLRGEVRAQAVAVEKHERALQSDYAELRKAQGRVRALEGRIESGQSYSQAYAQAQAEFGELLEIAEEIRQKRARGSWRARVLRHLGLRRRSGPTGLR